MCQYIDLSKLIIGIPEHVELNPSNHFEHPDIKVELPICLGEEELVDLGRKKLFKHAAFYTIALNPII